MFVSVHKNQGCLSPNWRINNNKVIKFTNIHYFEPRYYNCCWCYKNRIIFRSLIDSTTEIKKYNHICDFCFKNFSCRKNNFNGKK